MAQTQMANLRMQEKLAKGAAIAVDTCGVIDPELGGDVFVLDANITEETISGMDLCVKETEEWIWSVGERADGRLLAALDNRFYMDPAVRCVWLR